MLAFAVEVYSNGKGTGTFKTTWNDQSFGLDKIRKLKAKHKNVKVVISIGGRGSTYPFNPAEKEKWIDNAESSLEEIITRYSNLIDGINVNYEYINTTSDYFAYCLGELLNRLVSSKLINVVSVAPSIGVLSQYTKLYQNNNDIIDWVNYQFYDETLSSKKDFEDSFTSLCGTFTNEKLLAGYSTDPQDGGKIKPDDFYEGCKDLVKKGLLHGIFIWNANYSANDRPPFYAERKAQRILTGFKI